MSNLQIALFVSASVVCFFLVLQPASSCAPTRTELFYENGTAFGYASPSGTVGRKRRSIDGIKFEFPVTLNVQTFYKFDDAIPKNNEKNADEIENQTTMFLSSQNPTELIRESKFANHERTLSSENGFLRISYTFFQGKSKCFELIELHEKIFQVIGKAKEVTLVCENETVVIKKTA